MCRISPISDDWVVKGFHLHVHRVELAMRPDHLGGIVFAKVFQSTSDVAASAAIAVAERLLKDAGWRARFLSTLDRAIRYMGGVRGDLSPLALGRAGEFRSLKAALERLEAS